VTYRPAPVPPGAAPVRAISARLEPDAIGVTQDVVIGTANAAPAVAVALTLAPLATASAYGSGPVILVCGLPMLIIANSYRRLNLWKANCGASFEWVGRAISPYLGFLAGWRRRGRGWRRPGPSRRRCRPIRCGCRRGR
jgi:hypothetical protein